MENYDRVLEITTASQNSAGTSAEKYGAYMNSMEAKINQLIATWERFVNNINQKGTFNNLISAGESLIEILDKVLNQWGALNSLAIPATIGILAGVITSKLGNAIRKVSDDIGNFSSAVKKTGSVVAAFKSSTSVATSGISLLSGAIGIATTAISMIVSAINEYNRKIRESIIASADSANAYLEQSESIENLIEKYSELNEKLKENKSSSKDVQSIKSELLDIQNQLNDKYEDEHEKLSLVNGDYDAQIKKIRELNKEEATKFEIENRTAYKNAENLLSQKKTYTLVNLQDIFGEVSTPEVAAQINNVISELRSRLGQDVIDMGVGTTLKINVDTENAEEKLIELDSAVKEIAEDMGFDATKIFEGIGKAVSSLDFEAINAAKDLRLAYQQSIVAMNDEYYNKYQDLSEAIQKYNEALQSGDTAKIEKTKKDLDSVKQSITGLLNPTSGVNLAFQMLLDAIDTDTEAYSNLKSEIENPIDNSAISSNIAKLKEQQYTADEVRAGGIEAFDELAKYAEDTYGIGLESLIELLTELGIIQKTTNEAMSDFWSGLGDDINSQIDKLREEIEGLGISLGDLTDFNEATSLYADGLLNIESSYNSLLDAVEEFNSQGFISAQTFKSLSDNNLLQYLTEVDGKLIANTDSLFNNSNSIRENAIQSAKLIALKQIQAIVEEVLNNEEKATEEQTDNTSSAINALLPILNKMAAGEINAAVGAELLHKALDGQGISTSSVNKIMKESINVLAGFEATLGNINNLGENFTRITRNGSSASKEFTDSLKEQKEVLENEKEAIEDLIEAFIKMFKQQLKEQKEAENDRYDQVKKNLEAEERQQERLFEDKKDKIEELRDLDNDYYEDRIDALDKELDAYNKKIDAQKELLQAKKEEQEYEKDLEEKVKDVAKIQSELAKLQFDDSIEAQKKKIELAEQLAEKQGELDDFQADHNYELQEDALDKEQQRFEELQNAKKEALEQERSDWEDYWDERLKSLEKEEKAWKRAFEDRETEAENFHDNEIKRIEDLINNEKQLRLDAIEAIDTANEELYKRLLEWNRTYGTGIDRDIIDKWENAQGAIEKYKGICVGTQQILEYLTGEVTSIETKMNGAADAAERFSGALDDIDFPEPPDYNFGNKSSGGMSFKYGGSSSGKYVKSHTGEDYVQPKDDEDRKISKAMGLKSDEVVRILKVGEAVIPKNENLQRLKSNPQMLSQNTVYRTNEISKNSQSYSTDNHSDINISIGDTIIQGNADNNVINKLGEYKKAIVNEVFSKINKHTNLSGFRSVKRYV